MEAFQLLSRGGAKFDKKRFEKDVQLFNPKAASGSAKSRSTASLLNELKPGELPAEIDFFKYAAGDKGKGKEKEKEDSSKPVKKRKRDATPGEHLYPSLSSFGFPDKTSPIPFAKMLLYCLMRNRWRQPQHLLPYGTASHVRGRMCPRPSISSPN